MANAVFPDTKARWDPFFKSLDQEAMLQEMMEVPLKLDFQANANEQGFNAKFFNSK